MALFLTLDYTAITKSYNYRLFLLTQQYISTLHAATQDLRVVLITSTCEMIKIISQRLVIVGENDN